MAFSSGPGSSLSLGAKTKSCLHVYVLIVCTPLFGPALWKRAVNTVDFTLASFLQRGANQCAPLRLHLHVLPQAALRGPCQRKSIVFETLASRQHHPTDGIRGKKQQQKNGRLLKCNSSSSSGHIEGNSLCWHNWCS